MNVLMCRRLVAALYQTKAEVNASDDALGRARITMADFVPNQFVVLYGVKSLAIKNINEFMYGVRACRTRTTPSGATEPEPILHFFWRATHHGVPLEERLPPSDFALYIDLLSGVANAVGDEHTLNCKGAAAFWNIYGSMQEIELPVFVLVNVMNSYYKESAETGDRLRKAVVKKAAEWTAACKKEAPKMCASYKRFLLGEDAKGSPTRDRNHLPLDTFLKMGLEAADAQRKRDASVLDANLNSYLLSDMRPFDAFAEMVAASAPEVSEERMISLYQMATSGPDPDQIEMALIVPELRKEGIRLKRKAGMSSVGDGIGTNDDIRAATMAIKLFGSDTRRSSASAVPKKFASRWKSVGLAARASELLADLDSLREDGASRRNTTS